MGKSRPRSISIFVNLVVPSPCETEPCNNTRTITCRSAYSKPRMNRACDITLVVKNGKQFQADRIVLSQASPFFEKLLSSDMKEGNEGVIRLQTITDTQMAEVLQFIYNGNVQIKSKENAEKLISKRQIFFSFQILKLSPANFWSNTSPLRPAFQ